MKDKKGGGVLHWGCWLGSREVVKEVLGRGEGRVNEEDKEGETPIFWVLRRGEGREREGGEILRMLVEEGGNLEKRNNKVNLHLNYYYLNRNILVYSIV